MRIRVREVGKAGEQCGSNRRGSQCGGIDSGKCFQLFTRTPFLLFAFFSDITSVLLTGTWSHVCIFLQRGRASTRIIPSSTSIGVVFIVLYLIVALTLAGAFFGASLLCFVYQNQENEPSTQSDYSGYITGY